MVAMRGSPYRSLPAGVWDSVPKHWVRPERLEVAPTPVSPKHVAQYRRDPEAGEVPCVAETADGRQLVLDGKHHTLAALAESSPLRVHLWPEPAGTRRPEWVDRDYYPARQDPAVRSVLAEAVDVTLNDVTQDDRFVTRLYVDEGRRSR